jgi:hippurate hydrolase
VANIIPEQATLRLSVRSYTPQVRKRLLAGIERQVKAEAMAAGAPKEPTIVSTSATDAVFNDPAFTRRMVETLRRGMGEAAVVEMPAQMTSEDFSQYGLAGVTTLLLHVGAVPAEALQAAAAGGKPVFGPHSPHWAPEVEPTLRAMVTAETLLLLDLLAHK